MVDGKAVKGPTIGTFWKRHQKTRNQSHFHAMFKGMEEIHQMAVHII